MDANTLDRKTIVVTGATSGIGLAIAKNLVHQGMNVIGTGRSSERCQVVQKQLSLLDPAVRVTYLTADLSLQSQVHALAAQIRNLIEHSEHGWLDGLVNNAGTFSFWLAYTPEGYERQWAVNHLAPFLLTNELLPLLQAAPAARIVTVTSGYRSSHLNWDDIQLRRDYNGLKAYAHTKYANLLFTIELNARLGLHSTVRAFAADPGLVKTEIGFKSVPPMLRWIWDLRRSFGITPEESAKGIVYLVSEPKIKNSPEILWKQRIPQRLSRGTIEGTSARKLWDLSTQMCGLNNGRQGQEQSRSAPSFLIQKFSVLITGATGGLGKAFAIECANRGWNLFLTDTHQGQLDILGTMLSRTYGICVLQRACDLTDVSSRTELFDYIRATRLQYRLLINVAGLDYEGPFRDRTREEIRTLIRLNIETTLEMTHELLELHSPNKPFHIINVASAAAFTPMPIKAMYAASKRFILDFTLALREEVRSEGVTVTALCPGGMPTTPETIEAIERQGWLGLITTQNIGRVAYETIDAASAGRAMVVPGFLNRQLKRLVLMIPPSRLVPIMGKRWGHTRRKMNLDQA